MPVPTPVALRTLHGPQGSRDSAFLGLSTPWGPR